jgi:hypothetical protein
MLTAAPAVIAGAVPVAGEAQDEAPSFAAEDQVRFGGQLRRLKITNRGKFITALLFPTDYPTHFRLKPELFPFCTPKGMPVTGSHEYCFIHHQSLMAGHGKVKFADREQPLDFYRKLNFADEARADKYHRGFNLFHMGPSGIQRITEAAWEVEDGGASLRIDLEIAWQTRELHEEEGETLLVEKRSYRICEMLGATVVDSHSRIVPVEDGADAVFLADTHSFCGMRVHDLIDPEDGGRMLDSEGRSDLAGHYHEESGEKKAPRWIDCSGEIGGQEIGITMMAHPGNVRNQFYTRDSGIFVFSSALGTDVPVTKEQAFEYSCRHAAHDGAVSVERTENLFAAFSSGK